MIAIASVPCDCVIATLHLLTAHYVLHCATGWLCLSLQKEMHMANTTEKQTKSHPQKLTHSLIKSISFRNLYSPLPSIPYLWPMDIFDENKRQFTIYSSLPRAIKIRKVGKSEKSGGIETKNAAELGEKDDSRNGSYYFDWKTGSKNENTFSGNSQVESKLTRSNSNGRKWMNERIDNWPVETVQARMKRTQIRKGPPPPLENGPIPENRKN